MVRLPKLVAIVAIAAIALLVSSCGSGKARSDDQFRGATVSPPRAVGTVTLPDASNQNEPFAMRAEKGHLLLVYFGYTNCPDICPTTLSDIRKALEDPAMASHLGKVDLAMVTVDPEHDTGVNLARYLESFHKGSHALRTEDQDTLKATADAFGATYSVTELGHGQPPEVGHSAITYGVDEQGRILANWAFGTTPEDLAHDFAMILDGKTIHQNT